MSLGATAARLPAVVLGGYLGAGKTTLVNELLRQADGERIAVLVNDFGDISIDADLIEGASGEVLALAGGCVCCSFGADLIGTLQRLLQREPAPQRLLIECSGVGLPAAVARTLRLLPQLDTPGVVTVLDAADVIERARDPYVGDTVRSQLHDANRLVLNQIDRCDARRLDDLYGWLLESAPGVPVCEASHGRVPADWLWETEGRHTGRIGPAAAAAVAADRFRGETLHLQTPVDPAGLIAQLTAPDSDVQRAKGWVVDAEGRSWLLQMTPGRMVQLVPGVPPARGAPANRLLLIRLRAPGDPQPQTLRP